MSCLASQLLPAEFSGNNLLNWVPCGILLFQDNGTILACNPTFCSYIGYSAQELQQINVDTLFTISTRIFHQTHLFPMLRLTGKADEIYLTLRSKSGEAVPFLTNVRRLQNEHLGTICCAFMPVYQRRKYEDEILLAKQQAEEALRNNEQLRQAQLQLQEHAHKLDRHLAELERRNAELRRISEILSHDLREPVRKISTFTDLLCQETQQALDPTGKTALASINAACTRINDLLRVVQDYLSIDAQLEQPTSIDLNHVLKIALRSVTTSTAQTVNLTADPLPVIEGFPKQLVTLFEILLRNAVRRCAEQHPTVSIKCTLVQHNSFQKIAGKYRYIDFAQLLVTDNTRGFQFADPQRVFELLRKETSESTADAGLAICRKIVENHHGSISLDPSTRAGATFTILFPLQQSASLERSPVEGEP